MIIKVVKLSHTGNPISEPFDLEVKSVLLESPLNLSVVDVDVNSYTYIAEQDFLLEMAESDGKSTHSD